MKKIISSWLFVIVLTTNHSYGQQAKIDVTIHSRVDTTQREVKEVAALWIKYLNFKPDSKQDNPYWNKAEKLKYKNVDFSQEYLYQLPSSQLLEYYKPTILSIEKEGDHYAIRTIFFADAPEAEYRKSNPWCITKLYAVKEHGAWRLKNAIPIITENWNRKTLGKITYVYQPWHKFNNDLAAKASQFCHDLSKEFQFEEWKPFEFYITHSGDELGSLLNFDFFFAGYTTGIGMNDNRILLSGLGSEYYPHEFIHLIVPNYERHWIIEEGFATWKGGTMGKTFEEGARILAKEIDSNNSITFTDVLNKKWGRQFAAFYTIGAIFCQAAYAKGGVTLVRKLLETPNDNRKLIETICTLFEIEKEDIDAFWRREVLKFKTE